MGETMKSILFVAMLLVSGIAQAETYTAVDNALKADDAYYTLTEINYNLGVIRDRRNDLNDKIDKFSAKITRKRTQITKLVDEKSELTTLRDEENALIDLWLERKTAATSLNLTKVKTTIAVASL